MNLDQIATKCFILALFIRDDGQRLLLGDGYYDFNQKLQHFQGNTIANDIVEIQGDNGQLLAGQVMRSGAQKFEGYIGDATASRQIIEQKRSDFMAFFRIKHFYKVVYIFPDGTAIQRRRGYLTDAPAVPEIFQKFPEYSVALNFEDANYYEYAEDEHGDEIYAHIIELALSGNATGGLVWDAIGAVSNGISWSGIQTAQGEYISITNDLDIPAKLASVEMLGKAEQDGTPTPDAPQPISVVTGEQTVELVGKNILSANDGTYSSSGITGVVSNGELTLNGTSTAISGYPFGTYRLIPAGTYTLSANNPTSETGTSLLRLTDPNGISPSSRACSLNSANATKTFTLTEDTWLAYQWRFDSGKTLTNFTIKPMLELGSTATAYEPYQGQTLPVNLGKNLFSGDYSQFDEQGGSGSLYTYFKLPTDGIYTLTLTAKNAITQTGRYLGFTTNGGDAGTSFKWAYANETAVAGQVFTVQNRDGSNNLGFLSMYPKTSASLEWLMENFDIQLELGSQATSYSPYFTPIELAKIGNYQDRLYKTDGKWYIEKQVGKVVLNGTETGWGYNSTSKVFWGRNSALLPNSGFTDATTGYWAKMSDNFTYYAQSGNVATLPDGLYENSSTGAMSQILFHYSAVTSLADWKSWLASNPTTVYYALATPTTTEITNETLIAQLEALGASSLYVGVNNIGTETQNAMPTLKIEYYTEVDLEGAGYEWEPGGNTAKTIVTVAGVDSAWPIWTVQGGAQNPTLTNITTGQTITWQGFVPEGQTLTINMAEMTADLAGANVFEYITGEWIRLAPGNNTLVYTAGSADKPSTLSWNGVLA